MPIIKLYGNIKEIIGKPELTVVCQTLKDVFTYLSQVYQLSPEPIYIVIVNGQSVSLERDPVIKLKGSDVVEIIPPIGGG